MQRVHYYLCSDNVLAAEKSYQVPEDGLRFGSSQKQYWRNLYLFDFEFCAVTIVSRCQSRQETTETLPFSQMDPAVIKAMREKLVELGGHAPETPAALNKKGLTQQNTGATPPKPKG